MRSRRDIRLPFRISFCLFKTSENKIPKSFIFEYHVVKSLTRGRILPNNADFSDACVHCKANSSGRNNPSSAVLQALICQRFGRIGNVSSANVGNAQKRYISTVVVGIICRWGTTRTSLLNKFSQLTLFPRWSRPIWISAWEQRKLGELFVESDERSSTEEILSVSVANGIYPASESERDTNPGASIANYKIVRVGDIVYNSMRMWQGAVGSSRYNGIVSPAYVVAKPVVELDSTCFGYLLKRPELLYKYLCNSQGNSKDTQTLRYERFSEITAEVPSTIEEQRAISDCLEGLDNLITLHQRKC